MGRPPPTSFFQKADDDEVPDDDDMEELESILDECVRAGFASLALSWHYRSRHESLIAFSNHHYYDNRLHTFPAADHEVPTLGVKWRHVPDGFYDKGRSRTNEAEAREVVAEIERRLSDPATCGRSVGVVTFSQAQQTKILDLLDDLRQRREDLDRYFTEQVAEPVFVKNLENVQGDERDVMLFSVCYGPDRTGKVSMNFGPLNREGGERRLNVAVTRARELLIVFSTLTPDQIDLARTQAVGVSHLKTFLDYARRGPRAIDEAVVLNPGAEVESPFEEAVCRRLREEGYEVDLQVGCAGYRVDLAIKDPERPGSYLLGVECDGATYHSSRCARDRDRLRQAVLESLGWRLFRIWSLDWWHDPQRVMVRLREAVAESRVGRRDAPQGDRTGGNGASPSVPASPPPERRRKPTIDELIEAAPEPATIVREQEVPYQLAPTPTLGPREAWDRAQTQPMIAARLREVVDAEGPIYLAEATRRVGASWDAARATQRAVGMVKRCLTLIPEAQRPRLRGEFLWPRGLDPTTWRSYRTPATDDERRAPEHLPPAEVANAARALLEESGSRERDELVREVARLLGFRSAGKKVRAAVEGGIEALIAQGAAEVDGDLIRPSSAGS